MKTIGLILLVCGSLCWAQQEPLFPVDESLPPITRDFVVPPARPVIRCREPSCDMICAYGLARGEDNCPICKCRTPSDLCDELGECSEGMRCEIPTCFGEMCASVKAECVPVCPMVRCEPCPGGKYLKDERGCQTCQCETICPMPMCAEPCEFGYANDERGCMTCKCNQRPPEEVVDEKPEVETPEEGSDGSEETDVSEEADAGCPRRMCRMFCEYGFVKDERGCQICQCRSQPENCSKASCLMLCEYGFEKDERGCDICRCRQQPEACPKRICHALLSCPNGFQKDMHGCDTCHCMPDNSELCENFNCNPGMTCKTVISPFCSLPCLPEPVCQPPSVCKSHQGHPLTEDEERMMMPHLKEEEQPLLYKGPVSCRPDGKFEPKQCYGGECFCIDDRRVKQKYSLDERNPDCPMNITKTLRLSFELMHDLDDNDLDGVTKDIEGLVAEMVTSWMLGYKRSMVFAEVVYVKPGVLLVFSTVIGGDSTDLFSASHHLHKQMYAGHCNIKYKDHVLTPNPDTVNFDHHYDRYEDVSNFFSDEAMAIENHDPSAIAIMIFVVIMVFVIFALSIVLILWLRKRKMAKYQFRHKRMENMDNFKKNLILGSELDKPDLLSKDAAKMTLNEGEKPSA